MQHIKNILHKNVKQSGLAESVSKAMIIEELNELLKTQLGLAAARKVNPLFIKNKIVFVACLSSVMAQEINLHKAELINQLEKKFGQGIIKDIKFRL